MFDLQSSSKDPEFLSSLFNWYFSFEIRSIIEKINEKVHVINNVDFFELESNGALVKELKRFQNAWYNFDHQKYDTVIDQFLSFVENADTELSHLMDLSADFLHNFFVNLIQAKDMFFVMEFLKGAEITKDEYFYIKAEYEEIATWNEILLNSLDENSDPYSLNKCREHDIFFKTKEKSLHALWEWADFCPESEIFDWEKEYIEEFKEKDSCCGSSECHHRS